MVQIGIVINSAIVTEIAMALMSFFVADSHFILDFIITITPMISFLSWL